MVDRIGEKNISVNQYLRKVEPIVKANQTGDSLTGESGQREKEAEELRIKATGKGKSVNEKL